MLDTGGLYIEQVVFYYERVAQQATSAPSQLVMITLLVV